MRQKLQLPGQAQPARQRRASRRIVQFSILASLVASVVLVGGFVYGTYAALGGAIGSSPPSSSSTSSASSNPSTSSGVPSKSTAEQSKTIHLVALGDSLAHGFGDSSGNGFVGDVSQLYRQQGYSVIQSNFGIDGLTSEGLLKEVQQPSVQSLVHGANVILVSIGGNDLNDAAGLPAIHIDKIAKAETAFVQHLTTILSQIRSVNHTAPILLVGLYNPYTDVAATRVQTDAIVQSWDLAEEKLAVKFPSTVVVQTFDLFQLHSAQLLYVDHFHPNQTGYQLIAKRVWQDLQGK